MYKEKKDSQEEQEVDLTSMINEYSQDSELRKKIDDLKKQKEAENKNNQENLNPLTNKVYESSIFKEDKKSSGIPDIQIDDTIEKTRVDFNDDADKTLVIMNGKKSMSTNLKEDSTYSDYEEDVEDFDTEDDENGKTMVTPVSDFHDVHSFQEENDDNEEINDDEKKKNKMVTYIVIGIVSLVVVVGGFFGIKYAIDNFFGSSDVPTSDVDKPAEDTPTTPEIDEPTDITDNTAKIASLKKQKETYQEQLNDAKDNITGAKSKKKTAEETLMKLANNQLPVVNEAQQKADDYYVANQIEKKQDAYELAKGNYEGSGSTDEALKVIMDQAKLAFNSANKEYLKLVSFAADMTNDYNDKKQPAETSKKEAVASIEKYGNMKKELENKIKDIEEQLKTLESDKASD